MHRGWGTHMGYKQVPFVVVFSPQSKIKTLPSAVPRLNLYKKTFTLHFLSKQNYPFLVTKYILIPLEFK